MLKFHLCHNVPTVAGEACEMAPFPCSLPTPKDSLYFPSWPCDRGMCRPSSCWGSRHEGHCALCQGCVHSQPRAVLGGRGGVLRSLYPLPGAVLGGPGVSVLTARAALTVRGGCHPSPPAAHRALLMLDGRWEVS